MLRQCKDCPGGVELDTYLQGYLEEDEYTFNQWISTDRTALVTMTETKTDFIDKLVKDISSYSAV